MGRRASVGVEEAEGACPELRVAVGAGIFAPASVKVPGEDIVKLWMLVNELDQVRSDVILDRGQRGEGQPPLVNQRLQPVDEARRGGLVRRVCLPFPTWLRRPVRASDSKSAAGSAKLHSQRDAELVGILVLPDALAETLTGEDNDTAHEPGRFSRQCRVRLANGGEGHAHVEREAVLEEPTVERLRPDGVGAGVNEDEDICLDGFEVLDDDLAFLLAHAVHVEAGNRERVRCRGGDRIMGRSDRGMFGGSDAYLAGGVSIRLSSGRRSATDAITPWRRRRAGDIAQRLEDITGICMHRRRGSASAVVAAIAIIITIPVRVADTGE
jgi:hypothetical protein